MTEHINNHKEWSEGQEHHTCEGAAGECKLNRNQFLNHSPLGVERTDTMVATSPTSDRSGWASTWQRSPTGSMLGHYAPMVGDYVVDFTMRQFDPTAAFPHIEHKNQYAKRFHHAYPLSEEEDGDD